MPTLIQELSNKLVYLRDESSDFATVIEALYSSKFTGPITIHFKDGKPSVVDLPSPKIRLS
jgi:hypothetical protein